MKKNLNTDKFFREKLDGFSVQPPPHVWNNVKEQLVAQQRKKRIAYIGWISAAAVVVLAFIAGWYFNNNTETSNPLSAGQQNIQTESEISREENKLGEDKILSAELIQNQQPENVNIQNDSEINENKKVLSANLKTENVDERTPMEFTYQRIKMQMLESIDVWFDNVQPEIFLAEISVPKKDYRLNELDKFTIAENTKSINVTNSAVNGWKMGLHLSPGYSSHVANHSANYSQKVNYSAENGNGNVGGGFSVQYKTSKKLSVESGVYYAKNGQKSVNSFEYFSMRENADLAYAVEEKSLFGNAVNLSNGNIIMNSTAGVIEMGTAPEGSEILSGFDDFNPEFSNSLVSDGEFSQVFDFIEIPLFLRYKVVDAKFGVEVVGGVNAGVIVGNNAYIDNSYGIQNIGKTRDISTINLSGAVGVGINYSLGKHISMAVEPRLNYYFSSINSNPEVDFRPYRIGVYTGLYYEF
jgi:hypothetical protein